MHPLVEHYLTLTIEERKKLEKEFADYFPEEPVWVIRSENNNEKYLSQVAPENILAKKVRGFVLDPDICLDCIDKAINVALDLKNRFKNQAIYSLGRSEIFFVDVLSMLRKDKSEPIMDYIAFSGRYFGINAENKSYVTCNEYQIQNGIGCQLPPNDKQKKAYRKYLTRKGLSPQKIVEKFNEKNKMVVTDISRSSTGMISFLHFMREWVQEVDPKLEQKLLKSIHIHLLLLEKQDPIVKAMLEASGNEFFGFSLSKEVIKDQYLLFDTNGKGYSDNTMSYGLSNAHDREEYKETSFGSSYKVTDWAKKKKPLGMNQESSYGEYLTRMQFVDRLYQRGLIPNLSNTTNQCIPDLVTISGTQSTYSNIHGQLSGALITASADQKVSISSYSANIMEHFLQLTTYAMYVFFGTKEKENVLPQQITKDEKKELRREEIQLERKARKTGKSVAEVAEEKIQDQEIRGKFGI